VHCGKTVLAQQDEQNKAQKAKEKQAGNNEVRVQNYKQKKNVQYIMTHAKHILQKNSQQHHHYMSFPSCTGVSE